MVAGVAAIQRQGLFKVLDGRIRPAVQKVGIAQVVQHVVEFGVDPQGRRVCLDRAVVVPQGIVRDAQCIVGHDVGGVDFQGGPERVDGRLVFFSLLQVTAQPVVVGGIPLLEPDAGGERFRILWFQGRPAPGGREQGTGGQEEYQGAGGKKE